MVITLGGYSLVVESGSSSLFSPILPKKLIKTQDILWTFNDTVHIVMK